MASKWNENLYSKNEPTIEDVYLFGKCIIGCHSSSKAARLSICGSEYRLFCQSHGSSVPDVIEEWRLLNVHNFES